MDSNRALELLGDRSVWKIGLFLLVVNIWMPLGCWSMLGIVFVGMEPDHHCALPDGLSVNESVPEITKGGVTSLDKCNIWSNYSPATNKTTPCLNGWDYEPTVHSIVNEWGLVCDRDYLVQTSQTVLVVGIMVGALVMTTLADRIIPESMPWLTAKNKTAQAKQTMVTAACISRVTLPQEFQLDEEEKVQLAKEKDKGLVTRVRECLTDCCAKKEVSSHKDKVAQYTIVDVIRSRKLLMFTVINAYIWCTNSLVYYGLSLSTGSLAGNPYLNFFLSGLVEIPAYIIAAFALKYIGRRWSIFGFHTIAGIPLFVTLFIPVNTADGTNLNALIVALSMVGKFGITGSFGSIFLHSTEIYPTTMRNTCVGILSVAARIGAIIAPFSSYVAARVWWLPNVVFGGMAILAALLTLYLPETLNRPLPETIEEVERWTRTLSKEEKLRYKVEQKAIRVMKDSRANGNNDSLIT